MGFNHTFLYGRRTAKYLPRLNSLALSSGLAVVLHSLAQVLWLLLQIRTKVLMNKKQLSEIAQKRTKQTKGSESWLRDGDLLDNIFFRSQRNCSLFGFWDNGENHRHSSAGESVGQARLVGAGGLEFSRMIAAANAMPTPNISQQCN